MFFDFLLASGCVVGAEEAALVSGKAKLRCDAVAFRRRVSSEWARWMRTGHSLCSEVLCWCQVAAVKECWYDLCELN